MEKLNNENFVLQRMQELLKAKDWSIYRLAKESGLSYSSLNNIFIRSTGPSVLTLEKICNGFQITMSEFFENMSTPVFNTDAISAEERTLLERYRTLSKADKQLLNAYLAGLSKTPFESE